MKQTVKDVVTALFFGFVVPWVVLNAMSEWNRTPVVLPTEPDTTEAENDIRIALIVADGSVESVDLETYLVGVVLGEMPASFEKDALKAQAVVARTYTLRRRELGNKHPVGDVCVDPSCCQAYQDPENYLRSGGSPESLEKIRDAVNATMGLVLTYEGELIEATYFSSSGGRTEDAQAVWGSDIPYLQSTFSPETGKVSTVEYTVSEFCDALDRSLEGACDSWFGNVTYTRGGGVAQIVIAGKAYSGVELRHLLNLRSTDFSIEADENTVTITTRGYGHRVGMSQYGADAMAAAGSDFREILTHYYPGTVLEEFVDTGGNIG